MTIIHTLPPEDLASHSSTSNSHPNAEYYPLPSSSLESHPHDPVVLSTGGSVRAVVPPSRY